MKTIRLPGGMSWESTVNNCHAINAAVKEDSAGGYRTVFTAG